MQNDALDFLLGGGEMGARMRAIDWSKTPLGPAATWPQNLRTCVRIILTSRQPMFVWWGDSLVNLYNDAYRSIVGGKHPDALGQPAEVVWREIWDQAGPRAAQTMRGHEGTYDEALLLIMERNGYPEETYFTFSYSPVPNDQGGTGGILCANTDDTQRIIGERQIRLQRELAARTTDARRIVDAVERAAEALTAETRDVPFALVYLIDADGKHASLTATSGIGRDHRAAPAAIALDASADGCAAASWPLREVAESHEIVLVEELASRFGELPRGAWPRPPSRAACVPIAASGTTGRAGVLVVGLNPFRLFDARYRDLLTLVSGHIAAAIANAQAYEQEKQRTEALAELDRAKTTFFSNVSHELRTPLTLVLGPTEDALASESQSLSGESLRTVHRNVLRLLKLVNALLDFSRIEAGRVNAAYRPTDLAKLTRDLASSFRSAIERAGLTFEVACEPLPEPIFVDHEMWETIVLNLVSNALKFTFEGSIAIHLRWSGDGAELSVRDTGTGIAENELPHVFERFHRVHGARSRTHEGSGIGLALVSELVRLQGGSIGVASKVGEGTAFTIRVPRGSEHLPQDRLSAVVRETAAATRAVAYVEEALRWLPPSSSPSDHLLVPDAIDRPSGNALAADGDAHIVLADDNADMRDYVARLLRRRWSVETVSDGEQALRAIRERKPDLVLTDVMMPHLDGFGLLRSLRADPSTRAVPVIMLSARAGEESRVEGLEAGADDYLTKPFSARELIARVSTHLQVARAHERIDALRETAEQASRAKDEFLSTLSHELRTPLNAIVGWAKLLQRGAVPVAQLPKVVETIDRNARAQARLIEDLLELSRIEQGKLVLTVAPLEMARVVEAAIDACTPAAEAKGVRIQRVLDAGASVVGDPDRLQQIAWNLIANAIKFTPRDGSVQVRLRGEQSLVELVVSDDGHGIDASCLPYVFERFWQADGSSTRRAGGLGLGLAIVRSLVELHGGTVTAESEGLDRGATFRVRLPTSALRHERAPAPRERPTGMATASQINAPPELKGLRVLVVDDEPETRALVQFVLDQCNAVVSTASSAAEALALLQSASFDALMSDVGMPDEDGHALIRKVRALPSPKGRIPAVALTAYARSEDRAAAFMAGFDVHLAKPIDPAELLVVLARLVGRRRSASAVPDAGVSGPSSR